METTAIDMVNHPNHYKGKDWEAIEILEALNLGPEMHIGCVLAYLVRYERKGGRQDIEKALWYLRRVADDGDLMTALYDICPSESFDRRMYWVESNFGITDDNIIAAIHDVMNACTLPNGGVYVLSAIDHLEAYLAHEEPAHA